MRAGRSRPGGGRVESERPAMHGETLAGGNVNQVVRIGGTVRRTMGGWSSSVHALLQHLRFRGFQGAPEFMGVDEAGREVLTFIPGEVAGDRYPNLPGFMWSDAALAAFAQLLRQYHDATQGFRPPTLPGWQLSYPDRGQHEVICHNDFALYNVVFRGGLPVAVFDFDMAGPGPRLWDIAYALYNAVPLASFAPAIPADTTVGYATERHASARRRRIALFFRSYGLSPPPDLEHWVVTRLRTLCETLSMGAAQGNPAYEQMVTDGHLAHYEREVVFLERNFRRWV